MIMIEIHTKEPGREQPVEVYYSEAIPRIGEAIYFCGRQRQSKKYRVKDVEHFLPIDKGQNAAAYPQQQAVVLADDVTDGVTPFWSADNDFR